jgi:hypothetical protein
VGNSRFWSISAPSRHMVGTVLRARPNTFEHSLFGCCTSANVYVPANGIDNIPLGCAKTAPGTTLTPQCFDRVNDALTPPN